MDTGHDFNLEAVRMDRRQTATTDYTSYFTTSTIIQPSQSNSSIIQTTTLRVCFAALAYFFTLNGNSSSPATASDARHKDTVLQCFKTLESILLPAAASGPILPLAIQDHDSEGFTTLNQMSRYSEGSVSLVVSFEKMHYYYRAHWQFVA